MTVRQAPATDTTAVADQQATSVLRTHARRMWRDVRGRTSVEHVLLAIVVVSIVVLVWTRFVGLDQGLQLDEAVTVQRIRGGLGRILGGAFALNNHVLFSLAAWTASSAFGSSEAVYRLWSVLPALGAVGLVAWWARARFGLVTAAGIVALFAVSATHLDLAIQARGYGMAYLWAAALLVSADRMHRSDTRAALAWFCVAAGAGVLTLGILAPVVAAHAAVLAAVLPHSRRKLMIGLAAAALACAVVYAPMLLRGGSDQPSALTVGYEEPSLSWHGVITEPLRANARQEVRAFLPLRSLASSSVLAFFAGSALVALGLRRLHRKRELTVAAHLVAPMLVTYGALILLRSFAAPRFTSFFLVHMSVLLALGIAELVTLTRRRRVLRLLLGAGLCMSLVLGLGRTVEESTSRKPLDNFRTMAEIAKGTGISQVVAPVLKPWSYAGIEFYLGDGGVEPLTDAELVQRFCTTDRPLVYLEVPRSSRLPRIDTSCLRQRGGVRIAVKQRFRRPGVWVLGSPDDSSTLAPTSSAASSSAR